MVLVVLMKMAKEMAAGPKTALAETKKLLLESENLSLDEELKKLEKEFKSVERSYIPINSVIRIDEVVESGEAKIKQPKSQVAPTPINIHPANK